MTHKRTVIRKFRLWFPEVKKVKDSDVVDGRRETYATQLKVSFAGQELMLVPQEDGSIWVYTTDGSRLVVSPRATNAITIEAKY